MHLFLISLPEPSARRTSGLRKVQSTGLRYEILDGIEASKWRPEELPVDNSKWSRPLKVGEVGCYMAHLRAMQRIVEYNLPWACILEDDFCFEADPDFGLCEIESFLPADFHFIYLQRDLGLNRQVKIIHETKHFRRILNVPFCSSGYIVSNPLAQYIVENHAICKMPIDHLFSKLSHEGNFYLPRKPLVGIQLGLSSAIHKKILLDCGSHFGQGIASLYSEGFIDEQFLIYAFEPNPDCQFPQRAKEFPLQIEVLNAAVWIHEGKLPFNQHIPGDRKLGKTGQASSLDGIGFHHDQPTETIVVDAIDLDQFIARLPADAEIHCKLDVEGAEFAILRKLIETGRIRRIKRLYVEFHQRYMDTESDASVAELIQVIKDNGVDFHRWY